MRKRGNVMDVFDVAVLVSMGLLAVFFASIAVWDWRDERDARRGQRADAQVIQYPQSDRRANPAA